MSLSTEDYKNIINTLINNIQDVQVPDNIHNLIKLHQHEQNKLNATKPARGSFSDDICNRIINGNNNLTVRAFNNNVPYIPSTSVAEPIVVDDTCPANYVDVQLGAPTQENVINNIKIQDSFSLFQRNMKQGERDNVIGNNKVNNPKLTLRKGNSREIYDVVNKIREQNKQSDVNKSRNANEKHKIQTDSECEDFWKVVHETQDKLKGLCSEAMDTNTKLNDLYEMYVRTTCNVSNTTPDRIPKDNNEAAARSGNPRRLNFKTSTPINTAFDNSQSNTNIPITVQMDCNGIPARNGSLTNGDLETSSSNKTAFDLFLSKANKSPTPSLFQTFNAPTRTPEQEQILNNTAPVRKRISDESATPGPSKRRSIETSKTNAKAEEARFKEILDKLIAGELTSGISFKENLKESWRTLKHVKPSNGLIELIEGTGVYIDNTEFNECAKKVEHLKGQIKFNSLAKSLFKAIFSVEAMRQCELPWGTKGGLVLNRWAAVVILYFVRELAKRSGLEDYDECRVKRSIEDNLKYEKEKFQRMLK